MAANRSFRQCTMCGHAWATRDDFLDDPRVILIGYQVDFVNLQKGFFLFNHDCGTTLSVPVEAMADLYHGPIYARRATGGPDCPGYCLHKSELRRCPVKCECAFVREVLHLIQLRHQPPAKAG